MADSISIGPLEENFIGDTTPHRIVVATKPPKKGVEDLRPDGENGCEAEQSQEKCVKGTTPQGPTVSLETQREDMEILTP